MQKNVGVPMRDGVNLRADIYRPDTEADVPVVLVRTQYDKNGEESTARFFAQNCYIAVAQDVRGQYASEGEFYEFAAEQKDGYDTVEWAAKLPGSTGKVGMWGTSYVGATQWMASRYGPPHLATIIPRFTASSYYDGWSYQDGAWSLAFQEAWPTHSIVRSAAATRGDLDLYDEITEALRPENLGPSYEHLPLSEYPPFHPDSDVVAPYFYDWIEHSTNDEYWKRWAPEEHYGNTEVPVMNIAGWYDVFLNGSIENFNGMRERGGTSLARDNQQLIIGPWTHTNADRRQPWSSGKPPAERIDVSAKKSMDFGSSSEINENRVMLEWFDRWLKGERNGVDERDPVRYFTMGENKWNSASAWPLPSTQYEDFYLDSDGSANTRHGDGRLTTDLESVTSGKDEYRYDPLDPVPSRGGHSCCFAERTPMGPADQRKVENRDDVLVYSTPKLDEATEVTGPIEVTLYASSSAQDTDFTAKLVDVHPNGKAVNLNDGIVRARFRESLEKPSLIKPGKVYEYTIEVWPTSNVFKAGHQIRLEISSSNFPMYDRNPNTGDAFGANADTEVADQTVLHGPDHPSRVRLPLIPADD